MPPGLGIHLFISPVAPNRITAGQETSNDGSCPFYSSDCLPRHPTAGALPGTGGQLF